MPLDTITNCSGRFFVKENDPIYGQKWSNNDFEQPVTIPTGAIYEFAYHAEGNYTYITILDTVRKGYLSDIINVTVGNVKVEFKNTSAEYTDGAGTHKLFKADGDVFNLVANSNKYLNFRASW